MEQIVDYFAESVALFPQYPRWLYLLTVLGIFGATQGVKIPIKLLTKRLKNENIRHLCNVVIMFIPLALSFGIGALYTLIPCDFSTTACFTWSMTSQILYEFFSRVCRRFANKGKVSDSEIAEDWNAAQESVLPQNTATQNIVAGKEPITADEKFLAIVAKYTSPKK